MTEIYNNPKRLRNITASEMSALLGVNPYSSPAKVLENKLNPKKFENISMRIGNLMEQAVLKAFDLDLGMGGVEPWSQGTVVSKDDRIAATPDGIIINKHYRAMVEAKTTRSQYFEKWYSAVPKYYHLQVLVQMMVTGSDKGYIGVLEVGDPDICEWRFCAWEIFKNEEIEALMKQEVKRFWESADLHNKTIRVDSKVKNRVVELLENPEASLILYPNKETIQKEREEKVLNEVKNLPKFLPLFK